MFKMLNNINNVEFLNVKKFVISGNPAKNINANKCAAELRKECQILMVIICAYKFVVKHYNAVYMCAMIFVTLILANLVEFIQENPYSALVVLQK